MLSRFVFSLDNDYDDNDQGQIKYSTLIKCCNDWHLTMYEAEQYETYDGDDDFIDILIILQVMTMKKMIIGCFVYIVQW